MVVVRPPQDDRNSRMAEVIAGNIARPTMGLRPSGFSSIFTAMRNRAPLVITAGQQNRSLLPTEPFLFAEQATELPRPYVKWSSEPARAVASASL